jgi:hypothetical protein
MLSVPNHFSALDTKNIDDFEHVVFPKSLQCLTQTHYSFEHVVFPKALPKLLAALPISGFWLYIYI